MRDFINEVKLGFQTSVAYVAAVVVSIAAVMIVACVVCLLMPFAVLAPTVQHFYEKKRKQQ